MRPLSIQPTPAGTRPPVRVAVDLSVLRPGGENGGIKPFLFETLLWLGRQQTAALQFLFLTCTSTHADVRDELARTGDELICVRDDGGPRPRGDRHAPRERLLIPPPADLLWRLGAQVCYCPFGSVEFATPGVCTISTVVDVLHRDFPWSLTPHHRAARERMFQEMFAAADAVQCNSEHVISRLREHYRLTPDRLFTVYNAVHERFATRPPAGEHPPASSGEPTAENAPETPFFFYPANAWKHKNHEVLLLAYGIYRAGAQAAGTTPWPLVLTGHEDERWEEMRALAQTLGLCGPAAVRFLGYVPASGFGRLWDTAGALVFPSLHEGFGIPLLEAMQHDVPILCSREGSLPEVGADACHFVDARRPEALAEGMTRLATDEPLRQRLVGAGRRRRADFSQDREAGRLLATIVSLAQTTPPYRPYTHGIFPDGWTQGNAVLALPDSRQAGGRVLGKLTLRFHRMPAPRRLRLRVGELGALGGFDLLADFDNPPITVDFYPRGEPLFLEVPDAANLSTADPRVHGIRLLAIDLKLVDRREYPLFTAP